MTRLDDAEGRSARPGIDAEASDRSPGAEWRAGDGRNPEAEAAFHAARATLYAAVGGAFCYPDVETRATLTAHDAREGVLQAAERLGLREDAERFLDAVADAAVSDLEPAYNDLFGLPDGGEYPVVPYEAHYTTGSDVGESQRRIAAVVGLMETFGVEPADDFAERQDHVAAELELMQVVAAQRAVAVREGDDEAVARLADAEETVVDTHLTEFVPALAHDVDETVGETPSDGEWAYAAAARLAADLVKRDHAARGGDDSEGNGGRADGGEGVSSDGT